MRPKDSLLTPARAKNPQGTWGAFSNLRMGISGAPKCSQMDEGGEKKNEVWADSCPERRIKLLFPGAGARPGILDCRNGVARGIYHRLTAGDR